MSHNEGVKIFGHLMAEELQRGFQHFTRYSLPAQDVLVGREEGINIICYQGANSLATALGTTAAPLAFNYMAISTDTGAVARATATIPGTYPTTKFMSTIITPAVDNTGVTSKVTWIFTFTAASGRTAIAKFGMEDAAGGAGKCFNEYLFTATKDNTNNDLKLTYTVSIAP
jgi:hypothetical protein